MTSQAEKVAQDLATDWISLRALFGMELGSVDGFRTVTESLHPAAWGTRQELELHSQLLDFPIVVFLNTKDVSTALKKRIRLDDPHGVDSPFFVLSRLVSCKVWLVRPEPAHRAEFTPTKTGDDLMPTAEADLSAGVLLDDPLVVLG